jgi:glycosyltransferase involved in cell wall biosynthesis
MVGAFPPKGSRRATTVFGGLLQSCQLLLQSSLQHRARLTVVDSTQVSVPPPGFFRRLLRACWRAGTFLYRYERNRPNAVLLFSSAGFSFLEKSFYASYAHARGSQVLFFLRDGGFIVDARRSARYRRFAQRLLRINDVVLCQSEAWRTFFVRELGLPDARCAVVENWTVSRADLAIGDSRSYRRNATLRLLYLGWIEETKGIFDLLEAFRRLLANTATNAVELVLAGRGSAYQKCEEWVVANHIDSHVRFLGWVSGVEKARALKEADIFVLPSYFEGLSNSMLEAMAAGLPVVVTRVGGLPDVVRDEREGLLVDPRDITALHGALARLVLDENLRESLGRTARNTAARFEVEAAVDKLLALVELPAQSNNSID